MKKLPVFATFGNLFDAVVENLAPAFWMTWPWILLLTVVQIGIGLLFPQFVATVGQLDKAESLATEHWMFIGLTLALVAFHTLVTSAMAVMWHRYILRGELREGWARLRIDGQVIRYLLVGFSIALLLMGIWVLIGFLGMIIGALSKTLIALVLVFAGLPFIVWLTGFMLRLQVKLVAVALGRRDFSLSDGLNKTIGNTWRLAGLLWLLMIVLLVIGLVSFAAQYGFRMTGVSYYWIGSEIVNQGVQWFSTLLAITLLTMLYEFFVEGRA